MLSIDQLKRLFRGHVRIGEPLARLTTFGIGGQADFYFEPLDAGDLVVLVNLLNEGEFPFSIISNCSNVLASDRGYRGAAVNLDLGLSRIEFDGELVRAGAGAMLSQLVDSCVEEGLHGVEMFAGIPGTVGGVTAFNERAYGGTISDHLIQVEVIRRGELIKLPREAMIFGYRYSSLQEDIVVALTFRLAVGDKAEMKRVCRELRLRKKETQPDGTLKTGWIFKNPVMNSAARLIENCGLKGLKVGDAQISDRHPNFIVNLGQATSYEVIQLIRKTQDEVQVKFGVNLELEVRLLGFPERIDGQVEELVSKEA